MKDKLFTIEEYKKILELDFKSINSLEGLKEFLLEYFPVLMEQLFDIQKEQLNIYESLVHTCLMSLGKKVEDHE